MPISSQHIINQQISKQSLKHDLTRYDQNSLSGLTALQTKLKQLYLNLLEQKYQPLVKEQRALAAKNMEKQIKRLTRDDPDFLKQLR